MDNMPIYSASGEFGGQLIDITTTAEQFGFIVPVKITITLKNFLAEQNIRLDRFLKHIYRVYSDDDASFCLRVNAKQVQVVTCLETDRRQLTICIAFVDEAIKAFVE